MFTAWKAEDLGAISEIYRGCEMLYFEEHAVAKIEVAYDIHVRPSNYLASVYMEKNYAQNLSIKHRSSNWYPVDDSMSWLELGVDVGNTIIAKYEYPRLTETVRTVFRAALDVFIDFTTTPLYAAIVEERRSLCDASTNKERSLNEIETISTRFTERLKIVKADYHSRKQEYALIKPSLENLIIKNTFNIETEIIKRYDYQPIDWSNYWDGLFGDFYSVLLEKKLGSVSLNLPFDNLIQIRDMYKALHEGKREVATWEALKRFQTDWEEANQERWRDINDWRTVFFFDKENVYYRDLFLVLLSREKKRLENFLHLHGTRLDYSLSLRYNADKEVDKIINEIETYLPSFFDAAYFKKRMDGVKDAIIETVYACTDTMQQIKNRRVYVFNC